MFKRLTVAGLICLFTFNATFGALGGLVLCLHKDLSLHLEADLQKETCHDNHSCSPDSVSAGDCQPCVDLSLKGEALPAIRSSDLESLRVPINSASAIWTVDSPMPGGSTVQTLPATLPDGGIYPACRIVVSSVVLRL